MEWQREQLENLNLEIERLTRERDKRQRQVDKLEKKLKNVKGEVLTAEQAKDKNIKTAFGMAILPYKDVADLQATAKRVDEVDEKEKEASRIIGRKWEIIDILHIIFLEHHLILNLLKMIGTILTIFSRW